MLSVVTATSASSQVLQEEQWVPIAEMAKKEIQAGRIPGAVILIGNQGKVVFRRAFGLSALRPKKVPMTIDTIFDIASLTKVIATSTAVAQLVEMGKPPLREGALRAETL